MSSSGSNVSATLRPGSFAAAAAANSSSAHAGSSRRRRSCQEVSDQARRRSIQDSSKRASPTSMRIRSALASATPLGRRRRADAQGVSAEAVAREHRGDTRFIGRAHLNDGAELFREELRERRTARGGQRDIQPAVAGERHLHQRGEQAAIGAIVIREHQIRRLQLRERGANAFSRCGSSRSGGLVAELAVHLRERRAAEPIAAAAQIDEPQRRGAAIRAQCRRQRVPHVAHRRERRHDERHRRDDALRASRLRATWSSSTASPCPPESRFRAQGTAPRQPHALSA